MKRHLSSAIKSFLTHIINYFNKSIWVFPTIVLIIFIILVALKINGSSIGVYSSLINSPSEPDSSLIAGKPRTIRSDEWIVTTQMILAQSQESYPSFNQNIGNGQNMNIILDVPTKDWSQLFRPQNHAFFAMPMEYAFAYRWWFMAMVLLLAIYFLSLQFMPGRRLMSSALAVSVLFSAFIQWWYISATLACIAYGALALLLIIKTTEAKTVFQRIIYSSGLAYSLVSFAILLYPPFQIPIALVMLSFLIGYAFKLNNQRLLKKTALRLWPYISAVIAITIALTTLFLYQNREPLVAVQNTSYPGKRIVSSGEFPISHLLSGSLASQNLRDSRAANYQIVSQGITNQSESSTFIFLAFFLAPIVVFIYLKKSEHTPLLIALLVCLTVFICWLFIPGIDIIGSITKLDIVPHNRLVIGLGFLNILLLIIMSAISSKSQKTITTPVAAVLSILCFFATILVHLSIQQSMPEYIGIIKSILLATPVPVMVFLFLKKQFTASFLLLAVFSILSSAPVNPLYRGLGILTENPVSQAVRQYPDDHSIWAIEDIQLENIATINGRRSLSGVYVYPQLSLWENINNTQSMDRYNRYAHASFNIDRDPNKSIQTDFVESGFDQLVVKTEACSLFMQDSKVKYILSSGVIDPRDQTCIKDIDPIHLRGSGITFYIYTLQFDPL